MSKLLTTAQAAAETGLSAYELRLGWKQGRYPALEIGSGASRARKLRWNLDSLMAAIERRMEARGEESQEDED